MLVPTAMSSLMAATMSLLPTAASALWFRSFFSRRSCSHFRTLRGNCLHCFVDSLHTRKGVSVNVKYTRHSQSYSIPIHFTPGITVEGSVAGTLVPIVVGLCVHRFLIVPYQKYAEAKQRNEKRRQHAHVVAQRKREALMAVRLMQQTATSRIEAETRVQGLIIVEAVYGVLIAGQEHTPSEDDDVVIDVTIPVQCLVQESRLQLPATSKASLLGFYDPCIDEPKQLRIRYRFQERLHEATFQDAQSVRIPLRGHLIQ
eukprot:m.34274 g.34274  ORF g.34274 m.34274 type:complete len:258 (+) comp43467_c0_seq4:1051-1824(+)